MSRRRIWAALLLASLGWGTGGVASRAALLMGVAPVTLTALRTSLAALAVIAYLLATGKHWPSTRRHWWVGLVLGTVSVASPFLFFTLSLQYVSAGFSGLLTALVPAATAVWAHALLPGEPLHLRKVAGLSVAFAGAGLLMLSGESGIPTGGRPGLGAGFALVGVACASFGGVYAKRHTSRYSIMELLGPQFMTGALALGVASLVLEGFSAAEVPARAWGLIVYLALASSFLPFVLFYWVLQRATATRASLVAYLVPLIAVTAGVLVLSEQLTAGMVSGGALILLGVVLVDRLEERAPLPAAPTT
jgi:drug/metabolite transporter (DMT)-like permease